MSDLGLLKAKFARSIKPLQYFRYIDAKPGAGKTYAIVTEAARLASRGRNAIVLQPTKELLDQTAAEFVKRFPDVEVTTIHSGHVEEPVKEIIAFSKSERAGHVLLATHKAFEILPYYENASSYDLFVDEIPQIHDFKQMSLPRHHNLLTDNIEMGDPTEAGYARLLPKNPKKLDAIIRSKDAVDCYAFRELAARIRSGWNCYVSCEAYEGLVRGRKGFDNLTTFHMMQPKVFEGFSSCTFAGADFNESLLSRYWTEFCRVEFSELSVPLRFVDHPNGESVTIFYFTDKPWSKSLRDKLSEDDWDVIERICRARARSGSKLLWTANNDLDDDFMFAGRKRTTRLPNDPHGLNQYQDVNAVAMFGAFNLSPEQLKFLHAMYDLDGRAIARAIHQQKLYQAALRCSIRDPNNTSAKTIIVASLQDAKYLQSKIAGSQIESVQIPCRIPALGRPALVNPAPDSRNLSPKSAATARETRENDLSSLKSKSQETLGLPADFCPKIPRRTLIAGGGKPIKGFHGTLFRSVDQPKGARISKSSLLRYLQEAAKKNCTAKAEAQLVSPFQYEDHHRSKSSAQTAQWLLLDFDDAASPDQFRDEFPELDVITYPTFSHTPEHPKFRALIPLSREVDAAEYEMIARIFDRADNACKQAAQPFYLPCNGAEIVHRGGQCLDVDNALALASAREPENESFITTPVWRNDEMTKSKIAEAEAECLRLAPIKGEGYHALNRYMARLWSRMPEGEVRARAEAIVEHFHNPDERRREIEPNISSMRKNFGVSGGWLTR